MAHRHANFETSSQFMTSSAYSHSARQGNELYALPAPFTPRNVLHTGRTGGLRPMHHPQAVLTGGQTSTPGLRGVMHPSSVHSIGITRHGPMMHQLHGPSTPSYSTSRANRLPIPSNTINSISPHQRSTTSGTLVTPHNDTSFHSKLPTRSTDCNLIAAKPQYTSNEPPTSTIHDKPHKGSPAGLTDEELLNKALSLDDGSTAANQEIDIMTDGLKLQQQGWIEKPELKKLTSELFELMKLIRTLEMTESSESQALLHSSVKALIEKLHITIQRLKSRTLNTLSVIGLITKDMASMIHEIQLHKSINHDIEEISLREAERNFEKAKRRRLYETEYEKLAEIILSMKPREECKKDYEAELNKLEEVRKESKHWVQYNEIRKIQTDVASAVVRSLLESINNPSRLNALIDQIQNDPVELNTEDQVPCEGTMDPAS